MPVWDAEVAIDADLVGALLREQFSELDAGSARLLGEGWDNSVWLVEKRWAFRFPRRAVAIPGVEREIAVLPQLAGMLSVPIPVPAFVGRPSEHFPWPFFGAPLLTGWEPADAELADDDRVEIGAELGRFLRVLHDVEIDTALPIDPNRRADMPARVEVARGWLEQLGIRSVDAEALFDRALQLGPADTEVVAHGDLHVRHVLVDGGALSGVIDWGDVCRADPAVDLMLVWSFLPEAGRDAFMREYGPVDEERRIRARTLAVSLCAALAAYGRHQGHASLERECLGGLQRVLAAD
jgi:aminoglycoside phosphotransferase (APT) family kinase protein